MKWATFPRFFVFVIATVLVGPLSGAVTGSAGSGAPIENRQPTIELNYMICANGIYVGPDTTISRDYVGYSEYFMGEVRLFAANFAPRGWLPCDGRQLQIAQNQALFALIGTTYGGNGISTFALPDLRGRVPVGTSDELPLGSWVGNAATTLSTNQIPAHTHSIGSAATGLTGGNQPFDNRQPGLALHHVLMGNDYFESVGEVIILANIRVPSGNLRCDGQLLPIPQNSLLYSKIGAYYGGNGTSNFAVPDLRGRAVVGVGAASAGRSAYGLGATAGSASITLGLAELAPHAHTVGSGTTGFAGGGQPFDNRQPVVAMNRRIVCEGIFPTASGGGGDPLLASVHTFAGNMPEDQYSWFLPADGREVPIGMNEALFVLLGVTYGGNGTSVFRLPDLRGRVIAGTPSTNAPGAVYGVESVTLTAAQLPAHVHAAPSARELWRLQYFGTLENSGDAADTAAPLGDGVPNLLKFATGVPGQTRATMPGALSLNGASLTFTYPRNTLAVADGLGFVVEWRDALESGVWSTVGVAEEVLPASGDLQTVVATLPLGTTGRRFVRLRIVP